MKAVVAVDIVIDTDVIKKGFAMMGLDIPDENVILEDFCNPDKGRERLDMGELMEDSDDVVGLAAILVGFTVAQQSQRIEEKVKTEYDPDSLTDWEKYLLKLVEKHNAKRG